LKLKKLNLMKKIVFIVFCIYSNNFGAIFESEKSRDKKCGMYENFKFSEKSRFRFLKFLSGKS
jgi:hypothetical protein